MPLRVKKGLGNIEVQVEQDKNDKSVFNLVGLDSNILYPLQIINGHFENIENYDIYLFKNRLGNVEKDIFQISIKERSIAWMLPLSIYDDSFDFHSEISESLLMNEDKFKKAHNFFLKSVAYPVFHKLLLAENIPSKISEQNETYKLLDFYDYETNVLIVSKKSLKDLKVDFDLDVYLPSFYKYGYVLLDSDENFYDIDIINTSENLVLKNQKTFSKINIYSLSSDLLNEKYIIELFRNVLKIKLHPLVRFHFLYQVIELLINKIGVEYYKKKIKDSEKVNADFIISYLHNFNNLISGNFQSVNDIKESSGIIGKIHNYLNEVPNEENRINILFDKAKIKDDDYEKLLACAKTITGMIGDKLHENIYKVRNALVHSYHDLYKKDSKIDEKIQELNIEFEYMIVDILKEYSYQ